MKACIVGCTGYAGQQLSTLLLRHPSITHLYLGSASSHGQSMGAKYPHLKEVLPGRTLATAVVISETFLSEEGIDVVFLALPHGESAGLIQRIRSKLPQMKIIDLGADMRIKDMVTYRKWYPVEAHGEHPCPDLASEAVYGLSEFYREQVKHAGSPNGSGIIANPGCYATATLMAILPAIRSGLLSKGTIHVDAKSGMSGAGRQGSVDNLFAEIHENIKPYKVGEHRHTPEIEQAMAQVSSSEDIIKVHFSPSVVPMSRGILSACYAQLAGNVTDAQVRALYKEQYGKEAFIRLIDEPPTTKAVRGSNLVDVWTKVDQRTGTLVMMASLDNLMKGAAGQAVQNMNILFGLDEKAGLDTIPLYP